MVLASNKITTITLSDDGARFIGNFEGLRLTTYLDGGGLPTIGFGHRIASINLYPQGIIYTQAIDFMKQDVAQVIQGLTAIKLELPFQHQQDAVISLVYNIGLSAFRKSLIYAALESKATDLYAWESWRKDSKGVIESGLVRRREAEMKLFIWGLYS